MARRSCKLRDFSELPADDVLLRAAVVSLAQRFERVAERGGVYVLLKDGAIVYVGATSSLDARLRTHRCADRGFGLAPIDYDDVLFLELPEGVRAACEGALIRALMPRRNRDAPPFRSVDEDNAILESLGMQPHSARAVVALAESRGSFKRYRELMFARGLS